MYAQHVPGREGLNNAQSSPISSMNDLDSSILLWKEKHTHKMHYFFDVCGMGSHSRSSHTVHLYYSPDLTAEMSSLFVDDGRLDEFTWLARSGPRYLQLSCRAQKQYVLGMCFCI